MAARFHGSAVNTLLFIKLDLDAHRERDEGRLNPNGSPDPQIRDVDSFI